MTLYLGIDLGTQSLKAVLLDATRGVVGEAHEPLTTIDGLPQGHSEQHPRAWRDALVVAVKRACAQVPGARERLVAIGVSGQQHGLVALDHERQVIRPCKLWNDVSSARQCEAITRELGEKKLVQRIGMPLAPGFTAGKVRWLAENEPEHFARLRLVLLPHDWLNLFLTGEPTMEHGDASGTGFFDPRRREFADDVCRAVAPKLRDCLPRLLAPGEPAGRLTRAAAQALDLHEGVLVSHGGGDNMMAAIGAGAVTPGIGVLSLGTSGTIFACADRATSDPSGEIAAFCDSTGRWLPLGCTMNATVATESARRLLGYALPDFEAAVSAAPAGCEGVLCLPFFTGERSPNLPDATGAFLGLTPKNMQPALLARAALEGATFALARLFDRLKALGVAVGEVRLTGGGSRSATWQQVAASAFGVPVSVGVSDNAAALGAAVHACWTERRRADASASIAACVEQLGIAASLTKIAPRADWQQVYARRRVAWERASAALAPAFERFA